MEFCFLLSVGTLKNAKTLLWALTGRFLFSSPVRKYRKSYCSHPGVGVSVGVGVGVAQNVKVFG